MNNKTGFIICLCAAIVIAGINPGCKKEPQSASASDSNQAAQPADANAPVRPSVKKPTLREIARNAQTWEPAFTNSYGKDAPDFTVIDINDKKHTLSQYKGKNVMLVFWATWCGPCIQEIPHLVELRKQISQDKLVMLAISYVDARNTTERVKAFVADRPAINYPVTATNSATMPMPYNMIDSIPCSFFIDPQGKIKLATAGLVPLSQMKQIIEAEK
jgi:peroxiredoxin